MKYDLKTAEARYAAGKLPESPVQRGARTLKLARNRAWLRQLHACVVQVINEHGFDLGGATKDVLQGHARKVWGILGRTQGEAGGARAASCRSRGEVPAAGRGRGPRSCGSWTRRAGGAVPAG